MSLTDQEMREVLARAEEIQRTLHSGAEASAEIESLIAAGEEVGFSRVAMERAVRERLKLPITPPAPGTLTFARSADDRFYVAEVLAVTPDGVRVRFLRGSEHVVAMDQLRQCSFIPGERISCFWPWWGAWNCTLVSYDAAKQKVKLNDRWGETRWFPVAEVWLPAERKADDDRKGRRRVYATLLGAGAVLGAVVGAALTFLLA